MNFQVMTVTPQAASKWLESNGKNRKISSVHVSKIVASIKKNEWVLNGEPILFDEAGRLIDGQHRLTAVVQANQPIQSAVITGVTDPNAFQTIGVISRPRGADQIAEMKGVSNAQAVTAAARVVHAYEASKTITNFRAIVSRPVATPGELSDKAVEIEEEYIHCKNMLGHNLFRSAKVGTAVIGVFIILNRIDPVNTSSFLHKVRTGVVSIENDPAMTYRDKLLSARSVFENDQQRKFGMMAMTIKAWNANITGKPMKVLKFNFEKERFPCPYGSEKLAC